MEKLRSCLFDCRVGHTRVSPVKHKFLYSYFMFLVDLDELQELSSKLKFLSNERSSIYSFRRKDHYQQNDQTTKLSVLTYLEENKVDTCGMKIWLLTNFRTFGYQFNPVSFYFGEVNGRLTTCLAEVGNTFGEQKLYMVPLKSEGHFEGEAEKQFYVSPFSSVRGRFHFSIRMEKDQFRINIDSSEENGKVLYSVLEGKYRTLDDKNLLIKTISHPLVTLKVISMIHWQAMKLWLKRAPYFRKHHEPEHQSGHYIIKK